MSDRLYSRTDLALEEQEKYEQDNVEISGVELTRDEKEGIITTKVNIFNKNGAGLMGKPMGNYITIEAQKSVIIGHEGKCRMINSISGQLINILSKDKPDSLLIVGLGNRSITPDALGPFAVDKIIITRKVTSEIEADSVSVSAIAPGVMGQTGMEAAEIIKAVKEEIEPKVIIVIDALAARSINRLNTTIQITDTGISPGSGVGNNRASINSELLGVPVIAVGVPTVVDAGTIVRDRINNVLEKQEFTGRERDIFLSQFYEDELDLMFVTPKDIDEAVRGMSEIIAEAINLTVRGLV